MELKAMNKDVKITITIGSNIWREDWYKKLSEHDISELEDAMDLIGEDEEKEIIKNAPSK